MRGVILHLTRAEVEARALSQIIVKPAPPAGAPKDAGGRFINYRLEGGYNGGFDPTAPNCASWSFGNRTPTADCIGLALWASGIDRKQPGYKGSRGEWLNCASLLDDADGAKKFCRPLMIRELPMIGDWLLTRDHIGVVVYVGGSLGAWDLEDIQVVDCSPRHGRAHAVGIGGPWDEDCRVIRPLFYTEAA